MEILTTYGLQDMTMRRLAQVLSVAPSALYWHIPNKQQLLSAIAERITSPFFNPSTDPGLLNHALNLCDCLLSCRDGAEIVASAFAQPDNPLRSKVVAQFTESLASELAADTIINHLIGACLFEQTRSQLAKAADPSSDTKPNSSRVKQQIRLLVTSLRRDAQI